jgi:adenylate kinase family enzyme
VHAGSVFMGQDVQFEEKKVFVLGLPGSGKSTAARYMEAVARDHQWKTFRVSDYDILYSMFQADRASKRFSATQHGGFDVRDLTVFDIALRELETQVWQEPRPSGAERRLVIIEFARANYVEALKNFTDDFLNDAHFLFINTDIPTCIQRIRKRAENPQTPDDHFVSEYIFKSYYHQDNRQYTNLITTDLLKTYAIKFDVIDNPASQSIQGFCQLVGKYVSSIICPETFEPGALEENANAMVQTIDVSKDHGVPSLERALLFTS